MFFFVTQCKCAKEGCERPKFRLEPTPMQCSFDSALFESSPENKKVFNGTDIMIFTLLSPKRRSVKKVVF